MHSVEPSRPQASTFGGRSTLPEATRPSTANTYSPATPTQTPQVNGFAIPDEFGVTARPTHNPARSSLEENTGARRLTITNAQPMEIPGDQPMSRRRPSANANITPTANGYIDEKKLFERAKATVEQVQGGAVSFALQIIAYAL